MASSATGQTKRRSLTGCRTCRRRHVKCDENKPTCQVCSRLSLDCVYTPRLTREERRRRRIQEVRNQPPRQLARASDPMPDNSESDMPGQSILAAADNWPASDPVFDLCLFDLPIGGDFTLAPDLSVSNSGFFDTMPAPGNTFLSVSPTVDMQLNSNGLLADLPALVPLTNIEREALDYYRNEPYFGFGNKSPNWSTHAILWETARTNSAVLHLLLAASQAEIGWRSRSQTEMLRTADKNYQIGRQQLEMDIASGEVDPLVMMVSFWFLHWHIHRRYPSAHRRTLSLELSRQMAEYVRGYRLHHKLVTVGSEDLGWSAAKKALVGRLLIWLLWLDTRARTLGEGGSMARFLTQSESQSSMAALYEMSKETLSLNWVDYPEEQLRDDINNSQPLDIVHKTWMLAQKVNNAEEERLPLKPEVSKDILLDIDRFGQTGAVLSLIRLTESTPVVRDRMRQNADWAIANYYAVRIYHFRCSLTAEDEPFSSPSTMEISKTVESLMMLLQESLANEAMGQSDRLYWPLFWAGIETTERFKQRFILLGLKDPGLNHAMCSIFQMQEAGARLGMTRIRQILQTSCAVLDIGMGI
ncbi:hypothetical protein QBC43DRAFT_328401 [Cladorrhinum sp. PSN259]|nr:hypothetical protein QBC43DRAFT_328401 [Cladorrhinum sp. PSN259]